MINPRQYIPERWKSFYRFRQWQHEGNHMSAGNYPGEQKQVCLNCQGEFQGDYCPYCGQRVAPQRLTLPDLIHYFFALFTYLNRGLIHTLEELLLRPGYMVRDYLNGHRAEYTQPVTLLFILVATQFMITGTSALYDKAAESEEDALVYEVANWIVSNFSWFALFLVIVSVPSFFLAAKWTRLKSRPNWAESFVFLAYYICCGFLIAIIRVSFFKVAPMLKPYSDSISGVLSLFQLFIYVWMVHSCFGAKWGRSVWTVLLAFILLLVMIGVLIVTLAIILATTTDEF